MAEAPAPAPTRTYRPPVPPTWWLRMPTYTLYMVREITPLFMTAWLIWFLVDVYRAAHGGYSGHAGDMAFIVFSVICLIATLYHAITFLNLSGMILRVPMGGGYAPPGAIKALSFGGLIGATLVGGAILIWLGTWKL